MPKATSFKIVLLGEGRVGKTSLVLRYVNDEFDDRQTSTLQASFLKKRLNMGGSSVLLNIWDTAGQERFHALGPIYYRDAGEWEGACCWFDKEYAEGCSVLFRRKLPWLDGSDTFECVCMPWFAFPRFNTCPNEMFALLFVSFSLVNTLFLLTYSQTRHSSFTTSLINSRSCGSRAG